MCAPFHLQNKDYFIYRWWGRRRCPDVTKPSADETSELQIENVAGVFFILLGGILCAAIACGFEYFSKVVKGQDGPKRKVSLTRG